MHKTAPAHPLLLVVDDDAPVPKVVERLAGNGRASVDSAVEAVKRGAREYLTAAKLVGMRCRALYRPRERHDLIDEEPARRPAPRART